MNPKRVVIVGGSGFIGSALAKPPFKEGGNVPNPTRRRSPARPTTAYHRAGSALSSPSRRSRSAT